eukprot:SAG31_NODE_4119_length_3564_cov_2.071861_3_plen_228_part_00
MGAKFTSLKDLRLVVYKEGDFYDWHPDEFTSPSKGFKYWDKKVTLMTMVVNLQSPTFYEGGALQIGTVADVDRAQGNALFFPSYSLTKVHPVTSGVRVALIAYMTGYDEFSFWPGALQHYRQIVDPQATEAVDATSDLEERRAALASELSAMLLSRLRKYAKAAGVSAEELDELLDEDDPKAAIIARIVELEVEDDLQTDGTEPPVPAASNAGAGADKDPLVLEALS